MLVAFLVDGFRIILEGETHRIEENVVKKKKKNCPTAMFKSLFGQKRGRQAEKMFLSNNSIKKQIVLRSKSMAELAERQRLTRLSSSIKVGK